MSERNLRYLVRTILMNLMFIFVVWLFWIDKPVWKWFFLVFYFVDGIVMGSNQIKDDKELK